MFTDSYIDGRWTPAATRTPVLEPATGEVMAEVANASVDDCIAAADAAHRAYGGWRVTAPRERGEVLRRTFELMIAELEPLARIITRENGKILADARNEVRYAAEFFRWFSEEAVRIDGDYRRAPGGANWLMVSREPVGVSLLVTPWNFPAAMATRKIAPALAAGCTVVLKAASETPLTALYIADVLERAGAPAGVVNVVVPKPASEAVAALLTGGIVRKLSFTGSTPVGATLLATASKNIVNCSMELGGNAPFIVYADADLDAAVDGAMIAKMRNGGAACTAANRFYVEAPVVGEFIDRFSARMGALVLGNGLDAATGLGPMVTRSEQKHVAELVEQAIGEGAKAVVGGELPDGPGFGYPATVLADVSPTASIINEEIFGPVAPIVSFDRADEMIGWANGVEHGLVSYVFTRDIGKGMRTAEALESGMVGLNRGIVSDPAAPFGGYKQSGIGREGAHDGLLEFCETKYVAGSW